MRWRNIFRREAEWFVVRCSPFAIRETRYSLFATCESRLLGEKRAANDERRNANGQALLGTQLHPPVACLGRARVRNRWVFVLPTHPVVFRSITLVTQLYRESFGGSPILPFFLTQFLSASYQPANRGWLSFSSPSVPRSGGLCAGC